MRHDDLPYLEPYPEETEGRRRRPPVGRILLALVTVAVVVAVGARAMDSEFDTAVVEGRWLATEGRHSGLLFEITCERLLFQVDESFSSHRIQRIKAERVGDGTRYTLSLLIPGGQKDEFQLVIPDDDQGVARVGRSEAVWVRAPTSAVPWAGTGLARCTRR